MDELERRAKITPDGLAKVAAILASRKFSFFHRERVILDDFWKIFDKLVNDQVEVQEILDKEQAMMAAVHLSLTGWDEEDIKLLMRFSLRVRVCIERGYAQHLIAPPLNKIPDEDLLRVRNFGVGALREFRNIIPSPDPD